MDFSPSKKILTRSYRRAFYFGDSAQPKLHKDFSVSKSQYDLQLKISTYFGLVLTLLALICEFTSKLIPFGHSNFTLTWLNSLAS